VRLSTISNFNEVKAICCGYSPFGKAVLSVNVYFVDGLLIDAGQSLMCKEVLNFTENLPIQQICVTHHHEDHTGNLTSITKQHKVPVYGSLKCKELMKAPPSISLPQKIYWGNRPAFNITAFKNDELKTPNYTFKIVNVPGHSKDMIALYEPSKGWLFSGDLYINDTIRYMLQEENIAQQIKSIKKVLQLSFDTLFCGHNFQPIKGKEKLKNKLKFLEYFYGEACHWHSKGYSPKAILKKMKLIENYAIKIISNGNLSQLNMVKSAIRDIQAKQVKQQ